MWKASKFVIWRLNGVRVSAPYSKVETQTALSTATLVLILRLRFSKTPLRRRPKAEEVLLMRVHSSVSRAQLLGQRGTEVIKVIH